MDESEFLKKSLQIPSVSGNEEEFGTFLLQYLKDIGFKAWKDSVGNIIGEVGKGKPVILLCSHMDTVIGSVPVKTEEGKLYGRGAVDAKGSLCAMVCAAARFAGKTFPKIVVAGIVEEETTCRGINTLLESLEGVVDGVQNQRQGRSKAREQQAKRERGGVHKMRAPDIFDVSGYILRRAKGSLLTVEKGSEG